MKRGDQYKHFKGGDYTFLGVSIPLKDNELHIKKEDLTICGKAILEENHMETQLYDYFSESIGRAGVFFTNTSVPYVIYRSNKTGIVWARKVDDFFGYKEKENGELVKRFVLQNQ